MSSSNPLKWHGGKTYLASKIIELMPPHTHYVEPYFGGGAVLFAKPCEGVSEVVNDLNGHLALFWRVLQHEHLFEKFKRICEATPLSEREFDTCKSIDETFGHNGDMPDEGLLCRAHSFFVRYRQSRQGLGKDFATLSRNRTRRGMNEQVSSWLSAVEGLPEAHERLKRVVILNRDAVEVIRQQDGPNTFFYLDPPYLHSTRTATKCYAHEMSEDQHRQLLDALAFVKGKFILSGYRSPLYDSCAAADNWRRVDIEIDNKSSSADVKEMKTECLWMNY